MLSPGLTDWFRNTVSDLRHKRLASKSRRNRLRQRSACYSQTEWLEDRMLLSAASVASVSQSANRKIDGLVNMYGNYLVTVQLDNHADGSVDGTYSLDIYSGYFQYDLQSWISSLGDHDVNVRARTETWNPQTMTIDVTYSAWVLVTLNVQPTTGDPPTIESLSINSQSGLAYGTLGNDGLPSNLTVQYDVNGDGSVEGSTISNWAGEFLINITPQSYGQEITVKFRAGELDFYGYNFSDWVTETVTFEMPGMP